MSKAYSDPSGRVWLSLQVMHEAAEACESCCRQPVEFIIYESFVCASCAEVAK